MQVLRRPSGSPKGPRAPFWEPLPYAILRLCPGTRPRRALDAIVNYSRHMLGKAVQWMVWYHKHRAPRTSFNIFAQGRGLFPACHDDADQSTPLHCGFQWKAVLAAERSTKAQQSFGVDEKNVRRWRKRRSQLFDMTRMTFSVPRKGPHLEIETEVASFIRTCDHRNHSSKSEWSYEGARHALNGVQSRGWVQRFIKRFGFSLWRQMSHSQKLQWQRIEWLWRFEHFREFSASE